MAYGSTGKTCLGEMVITMDKMSVINTIVIQLWHEMRLVTTKSIRMMVWASMLWYYSIPSQTASRCTVPHTRTCTHNQAYKHHTQFKPETFLTPCKKGQGISPSPLSRRTLWSTDGCMNYRAFTWWSIRQQRETKACDRPLSHSKKSTAVRVQNWVTAWLHWLKPPCVQKYIL